MDNTVPILIDPPQPKLGMSKTQRRKQNRKHYLYQKQRGCCPVCKKFFPKKDLTVDHIIPRSQGGRSARINLQLLCLPCNAAKADQMPTYIVICQNRLNQKPQRIENVTHLIPIPSPGGSSRRGDQDGHVPASRTTGTILPPLVKPRPEALACLARVAGRV